MGIGLVPGIQRPTLPPELSALNPAFRNVYDNLYYLLGAVQEVPNALAASASQVRNITQQITNISQAATASANLVGTHAQRVSTAAGDHPVGTEFFETDRTSLYIVSNASGISQWAYVGGLYYAVFANRPADLGVYDVGFLYIPSEHLHWCRWDGSGFAIIDDDGGIFVEAARFLDAGYQLCDGTATTYLMSIAGVLTQVAITTPDEATAPGGVYHKSATAAYSGTLNAAVAPTLSGGVTGDTSGGTPAGTNSAPNTGNDTDGGFKAMADAAGTDVAVRTHVHTTTAPTFTGSALAAHHHDKGTLAITNTAEPRNLEVLRYLRR